MTKGRDEKKTGKYTWPNGSSYVGEVYNGVRHGTGSFKDGINGVSYRGQWDQGKRHGKGTVYYSHDKTSWYKGDWVKNNREGMGVRWYVCVNDRTLYYPSGNIYSGEWKNNLRHGEGTMKWLKQGQEYVGMWQDGVQVWNTKQTCTLVCIILDLFQRVDSSFITAYVAFFYLNKNISLYICFSCDPHEFISLAAWARNTHMDPEASGWFPVFAE
uniref:Radial spoke head component 1 n=1 Tax=Echeneis naucrates TaxID=173247 RepID=A0A665WMT7_ECHNA